MEYPASWKVSSCHSCQDLAAPLGFVFFADPSGRQAVLIERLKDKSSEESEEQVLNASKSKANLNPIVGQEQTAVGGAKALRVVYKLPSGTEVEAFYVVRGNMVLALSSNGNTVATMRIIRSLRFR